jgi:hypothetical protein
MKIGRNGRQMKSKAGQKVALDQSLDIVPEDYPQYDTKGARTNRILEEL